MGILASTVTQQSMIAYQNDLEYKISLIKQARMSLQASAAELVTAGSDLDPESPAAKNLEARREKLNQLEKKLDMQIQQYQTQADMAGKMLEESNQSVKNAASK